MAWFSLAASPSQFVGGGALMPIATLLSTYPAGSSFLGMYARVSDLWGNTDEVMRCSTDGSTYFWRPQRTDYAVYNTATSGTITLTPLVSPPILILSGALVGNVTITTASTNAWPGCTFHVFSKGTLGIFGINITGITGGTLPVLAGGIRILTYASGAFTGA